jgi:hypothetical protein
MGGSQLKQLKVAISSAGLSHHSQPSSHSKKRKRGGAILEHREKRAANLNKIHDQFNQFDVKVTKLKHDVEGRKLKGVVGKPTASKQAGIEQVIQEPRLVEARYTDSPVEEENSTHGVRPQGQKRWFGGPQVWGERPHYVAGGEDARAVYT